MNKLLIIIVFALYFGIEPTNVYAEPATSQDEKKTDSADKKSETKESEESTVKKNISENNESKASSEADYSCKVLGIAIPYQYKGECDDNLANTEEGESATLHYSEGDYIGEFYQGYMQGQGQLKLINGDQYEGEFKQGHQEGRGIIRFIYGDSYEGEFQNDKFNGTGTYYWKDSNYYYGEFANGEKHGHGVFFDHITKNIRQVVYSNDQDITPTSQTTTYDINLDEVKDTGVVNNNNSESAVGKFRARLHKGMNTSEGVVIAVDKTTGRILVSRSKRVSTKNGIIISIPSEDWVSIRNIYPPY